MMQFSHNTGLAIALFLSAATHAQETVAVKAGKVITMAGPTLENAVILIEDGRITSVGTDVEVPWNAKVIEAVDKTVMPTYVVAHCSGGMDGRNERMANVPFLSVADGIDPSDRFFEEALRNGVGCMHVIPGNGTLLGGTGMVVRTIGRTVEDMAIRDRSGLKLSLGANVRGKVAQIRQLRRTLEDARDAAADLEREKAEFEREKAAGATDKEKFEGKLDDSKQAVADLIDGKLRGFVYAPGPIEIAEVARMRQTWPDMDLVLIAGPTCYKAAGQLAQLQLPVVMEWNALEYYEVDPETEDETLVCPAKALADAGVPLVFGISPATTGVQRYPWWQMATAIRHGVSRDAALRALTTEPAKLLGLADELGTIEAGKIANLQVLTGDPLSAKTWVETVVLDGEIVYERKDDARLEHLFKSKGSDD